MPYEPTSVQLVGAGPGSADLLTLRAARAIGQAQVLLYDALVNEEVLALAPAGCLRLQTGKRAGKASMKQQTINRLMLRFARQGRRVVRLKGGDPSIFGRSAEEIDYLQAQGIAVEVVPGVSAASAAAAQFGFSLTQRGKARRLAFATVRTQDGSVVEDGWTGLADAETTLVLYMGRDAAGAAAERLIAEGRSPFTPAIAVENAGRPDARLLRAPLCRLGEVVQRADLQGPVLLAIGEAVAAARDLGDRALQEIEEELCRG
jgi:uroporphyrin-III C-methyltransferase